MWRLTDRMVRSTLVTACRLATSPTSTSPDLAKATTDGVVRAPSALAMTVGSPPSRTATTRVRRAEVDADRSCHGVLPPVLEVRWVGLRPSCAAAASLANKLSRLNSRRFQLSTAVQRPGRPVTTGLLPASALAWHAVRPEVTARACRAARDARAASPRPAGPATRRTWPPATLHRDDRSSHVRELRGRARSSGSARRQDARQATVEPTRSNTLRRIEPADVTVVGRAARG